MTKMMTIARAAACSAIALASMCADAANTQTVVESTSYGLLSLPATEGFNLSVAQMPANDTFLADYGFSIGSNGSFSSAVVTFDLSNVFQISGLTVTLLHGTPFGGALPTDLDASQIADRDSRIIVTGSGMPTAQTIDAMTLSSGDYTVEVSGSSLGTSGGTYAGLLNVAAVPEPTGLALGLAGLGLLALARRRAAR